MPNHRTVIAVPPKLFALAKRRAKNSGCSVGAEIIAMLLEHFHTGEAPPQRGGVRDGAGRPKT